MKACWLKTPVFAPGQLLELTVFGDGVFLPSGFAAATRRMHDQVFGPVSTRIEGSPGQQTPGPVMKPSNELHRRLRFRYQTSKDLRRARTFF